jgi:hypothetical protein
MAAKYIDLKCPHVDDSITVPPRRNAWDFLLDDASRLLLCEQCANLIIGTVISSTIRDSITTAIRRAA